jgi:hypothetical protein
MRPHLPVQRFLCFAALVLVILSFSLPSLFAQETPPTETPSLTPTATLTPSETPTPTATDTATETLTEIPIPSNTDTATPVPSDTPTLEALPSETATATPNESPTPETTEVPVDAPTMTLAASTATTLPPEPPLVVLFQDDFAGQELSAWALGTGWSLMSSLNLQALTVVNSHEPARLVQPGNLYNVMVQASVQSSSGTVVIHARQSSAGDYAVALDLDGQVTLSRGDTVVQTALVNPGTAESWRTLRLSVIEHVVRVAVDGIEIIVFADVIPLPAGDIAFAAQFSPTLSDGTPPLDMLTIDDVFIWVPQSEFTSYTATPTDSLERVMNYKTKAIR